MVNVVDIAPHCYSTKLQGIQANSQPLGTCRISTMDLAHSLTDSQPLPPATQPPPQSSDSANSPSADHPLLQLSEPDHLPSQLSELDHLPSTGHILTSDQTIVPCLPAFQPSQDLYRGILTQLASFTP